MRIVEGRAANAAVRWVRVGRRILSSAIRSGPQERTGCRFAIFAGCGILPSTSSQPSKGGDTACIRGPLGHLLYPLQKQSLAGELACRPVLIFAQSTTSLSPCGQTCDCVQAGTWDLEGQTARATRVEAGASLSISWQKPEKAERTSAHHQGAAGV